MKTSMIRINMNNKFKIVVVIKSNEKVDSVKQLLKKEKMDSK